ncbi:hypothetical protein O7606_02720 [Micromonospora sp. WMMD882]|uniref:hypothetical protein n=1 Tax=Micromonospora sp. WMMD882 TaxID=3015151 RepID=UPI00248C8450|nr:hypothetical protein [Micromonospora sp. WMMD882]WBB80309.1 hypothetical protein O7606_02720 [Micromonospora sp. WMMD882]
MPGPATRIAAGVAARIAAGVAAAVVATSTVTVPGSPASAGEPVQYPDQGLVFYSSNPTEVVGRQATPDDVCRPVPADATWALGWSGGFHVVPGYRTADCGGRADNLNSFHSWSKGTYLSYRAPAYLYELPPLPAN